MTQENVTNLVKEALRVWKISEKYYTWKLIVAWDRSLGNQHTKWSHICLRACKFLLG